MKSVARRISRLGDPFAPTTRATPESFDGIDALNRLGDEMSGQNTITFTDRSFDRDGRNRKSQSWSISGAKGVHLAARWRLPSTP